MSTAPPTSTGRRPERAVAAADPDRIAAALDRIAEITEDPSAHGEGVTRLGYTELERVAHRYVGDHWRALGLDCVTDAVGNTIATVPGSDPSLPALATGSHLDSVPRGGRFDGIAGVVAAMEAARLLVEAPGALRRPVRFVAFATEEGARFGQACLGSRMVAGLTDRSDLDRLRDGAETTVAEAMRGVGLEPDRLAECRWHPGEVAAFIELHIEQGGVLAATGTPIGVVDVISGSTRIAFDLTGTASHSGGTPMHHRADALAAAAAIVLAAESLATDSRHHGTRVTVGRLEVEPGSITTIPGACRVYVDVRDTDGVRQRAVVNELIAEAEVLAAGRGVGVRVELLADTPPAVLPLRLQRHLVEAAADCGLDYRVMPSGASHDTQMINSVAAGGMIFVPSLNDGVSHAPEELSSPADIARGTDVVCRALVALDAALDSPAGTDRGEVG